MRYVRAFLAAALVVAAACQDDGVRPDASPHAPRPDVRTGWMVGPGGEAMQVSYEVMRGYAIFEGDINLGPADRVPATREALEAALRPEVREGVRLNSVITGSMYRWRAPTGTTALVPYVIDPGLPNPQRVYDAMNHISGHLSSIKFVPRTTEADYIIFEYFPENCWSSIGKIGGPQYIQLEDGCTTGTVIHELGHALGLWHEQSRCDRDQYVNILWQNIDPAYHGQFSIHCSSSTTDPNAGTDYHSYDEGSIMHYPTWAFSMNDQPTITSKRGLDHLMGQRDGLSYTDRNTLATMYPSRRRACCS